MSNEIEVPTAKTFDLGAMLAGRGYPETTVDIYLDEAAGLTIAETNVELTRLAGLGQTKEYETLEKKFRAMLKDLESRKLSVTVKGVPRKVKADIVKKVTTEHPAKKDAFGRQDFSSEADEALTRLLWQAHVVQIVDPSGAVLTPSEQDISDLLDLAPTADVKAIDGAIGRIESAGEGFEVAARGADFLSKP
jgi:hypothetical protein